MIFDIMNIKEFEDKDISFIIDHELTSELYDDLLDNVDFEKIYMEYDEEIEDMLEDGEDKIFLCTKSSDGQYFIENLFTKNGVQLFQESDITFVLEELFDCIEEDRIEGKIIVLSNEEEDGDIFDDLANDFIEGINEDECTHCKLAQLLREVFADGRNSLLEEINKIN